MIAIGVDPGLSGGLAAICYNNVTESSKLLSALPMPIQLTADGNKEVNAAAIFDWLFGFIQNYQMPMFAVIEKVASMPKQGVVSTFTFGTVYGEAKAALKIANVKFERVAPRVWKKGLFAEKASADKQLSVDYAASLFGRDCMFPSKRYKTPHDGIADAICLASYGLKAFNHRFLKPLDTWSPGRLRW